MSDAETDETDVAAMARVLSEQAVAHGAAEARVAQLQATLDDVARGSTHELVRYLLEKLVAAEKYAAACEKTAALNQRENVQLKLDLAEERAEIESANTAIASHIDARADLEKQVETLYDGDTEDEARITKAKAVAQAWRDAAFGSQRMHKLKSETLERCAEELDEALR